MPCPTLRLEHMLQCLLVLTITCLGLHQYKLTNALAGREGITGFNMASSGAVCSSIALSRERVSAFMTVPISPRLETVCNAHKTNHKWYTVVFCGKFGFQQNHNETFILSHQ